MLPLVSAYQPNPLSIGKDNMDPEAIPNFLTEQRDQAPDDLQAAFITFEDLWERKLWHQLTNALIEYFRQDESANQRLAIYRTFILTFAEKINQLKLVSLGLSASTQCKGLFFERPIWKSSDILLQMIKRDSNFSQLWPIKSTSQLLKMHTCMRWLRSQA